MLRGGPGFAKDECVAEVAGQFDRLHHNYSVELSTNATSSLIK